MSYSDNTSSIYQAEIKRRYLNGEKPREIAKDYEDKGITAKLITRWITGKKWRQKRLEKSQKLEQKFDAQIEEGTNLAIEKLTRILTTSTDNKDLIAAARVMLDLSGLKKTEVTTKTKAISSEQVEEIERQLGINFKTAKNQK